MQLAFNVKIEGLIYMLELISLGVSFFVILLNFRTPVIVKGQETLNLNKVANYYWNNGMLIDLCGILPFNIILGRVTTLDEQTWKVLLVLVTLRISRILSCWQAVMIFSQFEVYLKNHNVVMGMMKASMMLYFLGHWITCTWFFVNNVIEKGE
jgi:hypothetical protein